MDYINIMKDSFQYLSQSGENVESLSDLAERYSYEANYFGCLFSSFFAPSFQELKEKALGLKIEDGVIPFEKEYDFSVIQTKIVKRDDIVLVGQCIDFPDGKEETVFQVTADTFLGKVRDALVDAKKEQMAVWIHDEKYQFQYFIGTEQKKKRVKKDQIKVILPESEYLVLAVDYVDGLDVETVYKMLVRYSHVLSENGKVEYRKDRYNFLHYQNSRMSMYLPIKKELKKEENEKMKYHLDTWIDYINEHLYENITIEELANVFGYSVQHFRHVFSLYYDMTASDYIRKKRMHMAAAAIRKGGDVARIAEDYGFKSYQGFSRAFKKEFHVPLTQYKKAKFEVVDLNRYYSMYKEKLQISSMEINEIKAICHTVIPNIREDADIPAQINYWVRRDFPCLKNTRFNYNKQRKEDKVALWYSVEKKRGDMIETFYDYVLGPVVEDFDGDIPDDIFCITIRGGKYAVFETDKESDREHLVDTIRMFARCVYFGWIKDNMEKVDFSRCTFERYLNDKVFVYVPIK